MAYRLMLKDIAKKLTNKEAYTFCCILLNAKPTNNTYVSHIKQERLSEMTGYHIDTIRTYIDKFEKLRLLRVETEKLSGSYGYFNRNTYYIPIPSINWYRVDYSFLLTDIPSDVKGYLLLLKCICYGGTNTIMYSLNGISEKGLLQIGRNTILTLNKEAISLNVITKVKSGYTITEPNIYADPEKEEIISDTVYLNYYKEIEKFCKDRKIGVPRYDRELISIIYSNCPDSFFLFDKIANKFVQKRKIYSLNYFITLLNMKRPVKREVSYPPIIF